MPSPLPREILTPEQAVKFLPFSLSTLYRKIKKREVEVLSLGHGEMFLLDPAELRRVFGAAFRYNAPKGFAKA